MAENQVQNFGNDIPCVSTITAKLTIYEGINTKILHLIFSHHVCRNNDLILQFGPPCVSEEARLSIYPDIFRCLSSGLLR